MERTQPITQEVTKRHDLQHMPSAELLTELSMLQVMAERNSRDERRYAYLLEVYEALPKAPEGTEVWPCKSRTIDLYED